jgi:hypothetical protein
MQSHETPFRSEPARATAVTAPRSAHASIRLNRLRGLSACALLLSLACTDKELGHLPIDGAVGGAQGTGGSPGGGGVHGSGGLVGTGGVSNAGGTHGSGGIEAQGGATGAGGNHATGGMQAAGGTAASGGAVGTGGIAATGGAMAHGGASGQGGAHTTGGAGMAGAGGQPGRICGGGVSCATQQYCDWSANRCGRTDTTSSCKVMPDACGANYAPVCGCDGKVYGNECTAAMAGMDVSATGGCPAPTGMFACGPLFCTKGTQYCSAQIGGATSSPGYHACQPLPTTCSSTAPACSCLSGVACGANCAVSTEGDLTATCLVP